MYKKIVLHVTVLSVLLVFGSDRLVAQKIYWTDTVAGKIQRSNLDGTNVEDILTGLTHPMGIAIDHLKHKLYWTNGSMQQANLDGSNVELVLGPCCPWDLALDPYRGKMYWPFDYDWISNINRANIDGSADEIIVTMDSVSLEGIALDLVDNKIYWTHYNGGIIRRSDTDGTNVETVITTTSGDLAGIAIDYINRKMYWSEADFGKIRRADLDGSNVVDILTDLQIPWGIALDLREGKIYWTEGASGAGVPNRISRANLDGSNIEELVTGLETAVYIALDIPVLDPPIPTVSQWGLIVITLMLMCAGSLVIGSKRVDGAPIDAFCS